MNEHMIPHYIEEVEKATGSTLTKGQRIGFILGYLYGAKESAESRLVE